MRTIEVEGNINLELLWFYYDWFKKKSRHLYLTN